MPKKYSDPLVVSSRPRMVKGKWGVSVMEVFNGGITLTCLFRIELDLRQTCIFNLYSFFFSLRVHKGINRIDLIQRGVIDVNGSFVFKVVARDHGIIPRSSNITVQMNIVDAGDDSPVFNR